MNIYPLAIFFRSFELKIDIRSLLHNGRERQEEEERGYRDKFFKVFLQLPSNDPRDWIHRASREARSLNTRNICFLSNETSLLNGTQHFSLSLFFFPFSIEAFRRFRIEALVVYYYKPLHLFLLSVSLSSSLPISLLQFHLHFTDLWKLESYQFYRETFDLLKALSGTILTGSGVVEKTMNELFWRNYRTRSRKYFRPIFSLPIQFVL